ncbi:MAG TPA: VOC family protein [Burkholderiales bacterium]|jgi:PhnB protein|nr:VOC family protein [Burkholderiales bacterium]HVJ22951.1 VOC family protein [Burkholderiales bacterium]
MKVEPYLMFEGRTEEALQFYQQKLGAKVEAIIRYKENPEPKYNPPNSGEKVMHSLFRIGDAQIMASDGNCTGKPGFQGFALTLNAANAAEANQRFDALADGGKVQMPIGETFFAKSFGMVADRFGVQWMVIAEPKK